MSAAESVVGGTADAGPGFAIRTAAPADLDAVMVLERDAFPEDTWGADTMAAELVNPNGRYLVATVPSGEVVGYAGVRVGGDQADIQTIAVLPSHRRRGVGRALVVALLDEAARRGARAAFLDVRADNLGAQTLYAALGFVPFSIRSGYYPGGVDAVEMLKELP